MKPDALVTVAAFPTAAEAAMARSLLEGSGIDVRLDGDVVNSTLSHVGTALDGGRVMVASSDRRAAEDVLSGVHGSREGNRPRDSRVATAGRVRGGTAAGDAMAARAWRAALIGVVCLPIWFYAVWLLIRLHTQTLGPRGNRLYCWALLLNLVAPFCSIVIVSQ